MRKNVTEYLDITEGLYSEKIAVEDANGCITFGEMKRNALKIAEFCVRTESIQAAGLCLLA